MNNEWQRKSSHLLAGLGQAIREQFEEWQLTPAEADVALLLLKGMSLREIAADRGTSERTVRHQATVIYRKGGVDNRIQLSAHFLGGIMLPE